MAKVTIIFDETSSEWEGLYIDGVLMEQANSIRAEYILLHLVGKTIDGYEFGSCYLSDDGKGFPERLDELTYTID